MVGWQGHNLNGTENKKEKKKVQPTMAMWCEENDPEMNAPNMIGHAFNSKDPNIHTLSDTTTEKRYTGDNYGRPYFQEEEVVTNTFTMCGYHWSKRNPFQTPKALSAPTLEDLERENESYNRGYEARQEEELLRDKRMAERH